MTEFVITKVEGTAEWDRTAEFFVQVDHDTRYRIPQYEPEKIFEIPREGFMRILCKEQDVFVGSVSFNCSLIPLNTVSWIPLLTKPEDEIFEIPCMDLATIWMQLTPARKILTTVIEVPEPESTLQTEESEDLMQEINLLSLQGEELDYNELYLSEQKLRIEHEETIEELSKELEETCNKQKSREEYLLEVIDNKDNELLETQRQVLELKKLLEFCNNQLEQSKDEIKSLAVKASELTEANEEIRSLKKQIEENSTEEKKLNSKIHELQTTNQNLEEKLALQTSKKRVLEPKVSVQPEISIKKSLDRRPPTTPQFYHKRLKSDPLYDPVVEDDPVDTLLKEKLNSIGRPDLFTKEEPNIYSCGRRKVFIDFENGQIMCRIGGGFKSLEEYIEDYCSESEPSLSTERSIRSDSPLNKSNSTQKGYFIKAKSKKREVIRSKIMTPFRERKAKHNS